MGKIVSIALFIVTSKKSILSPLDIIILFSGVVFCRKKRVKIITKNMSLDYANYSKDYFPTRCSSGINVYNAYGEKYSPTSICVLTRASASGTGNSGKGFQPVWS